MPSERDRMLRGELYDPLSPELVAARNRARLITRAFNHTSDNEQAERDRLLRELLRDCGNEVTIEPPFLCDYGDNIRLGDKVFFNFNCVILDVAAIVIGSNVLFGPGVQIYAATHPMSATQRRTGLELGKPVTIGDDVWVGGGAIICPGVTVGPGTVIGAGSVVTRDIPPDVLAAGNPCRVIKPIED